jgi:hypothetical protein
MQPTHGGNQRKRARQIGERVSEVRQRPNNPHDLVVPLPNDVLQDPLTTMVPATFYPYGGMFRHVASSSVLGDRPRNRCMTGGLPGHASRP